MTEESKMRGKKDGKNEKKKDRKAFNSRNEGRKIRPRNDKEK